MKPRDWDQPMAELTPTETLVPDLFASRWITLPDGVTALPPTSLAPGFRVAGTAAGIKQSGKPDLGIIINDGPHATSAARFTKTSAPAAPVLVCRERTDIQSLRAIIVNSGNANAATGGRGFDNAVFMQGAGAMIAGAPEGQVAVASTGVIGQQLNTRAIARGCTQLGGQMSTETTLGFADSIHTTDAFAKLAAVEVQLSGGVVTVSGQAKGAGMICPNHATLLCFLQTDAKLDARTCDVLLKAGINESFDRVTVDAQMSTNDSVFLMASGTSGVGPAGAADDRALAGAIDSVLRALAIALVRDGEGARRIAKVSVTGGDHAVAEKVARAVADSPLVKTALNGGDANWGRIIQSVGMALATGENVPIDITIEGIQVCKNSCATRFDEDELTQLVQRDEVEYEIGLPGEGAHAEVIFSDLSHEYVTINAEYRT